MGRPKGIRKINGQWVHPEKIQEKENKESKICPVSLEEVVEPKNLKSPAFGRGGSTPSGSTTPTLQIKGWLLTPWNLAIIPIFKISTPAAGETRNSLHQGMKVVTLIQADIDAQTGNVVRPLFKNEWKATRWIFSTREEAQKVAASLAQQVETLLRQEIEKK